MLKVQCSKYIYVVHNAVIIFVNDANEQIDNLNEPLQPQMPFPGGGRSAAQILIFM